MAHRIDLSPPVSDEVKTTTCYMCACRCGIKVHLKDGAIRFIEGNRDHPVNRGVLCAKGSAGIMHHLSPARLSKPLLRDGPRGSGKFKEISWDEAMAVATEWLGAIREDDPKKLAFFTGRDQSQALTGWWAQQFGTPNYAAHGGFCSVNMAAGGIYTIGGSFWEFGEPDWDRTKYLLMFGIAEDHDSNPIKIGLGQLKARGAKVVSVNPVRTGYSAIADEWVPIRPGTDGLLVLALVHEILRAGKVDANYLASYTNAPWLVIDAPGTADDGLFARGADGVPLVRDRESGALVSSNDPTAKPSLEAEAQLPDGRKAVPVFRLLAARYLDPCHAPEAVAARCGVDAATIKRLAAELARVAFEEEIVIEQEWIDWAGRKHPRMVGRPVSMHAMRGISAHSNGFHTCRAIHLLQMLLGAIDCPGAFRYKPPFPRPAPVPVRPGKPVAGKSLSGPPLGFPQGPEDLLVDADGTPQRIDKAFSWEMPLSAHGAMHMVIANAHNGDPYPIDTLFMYMANMAWNSAMNIPGTLAMLTAEDGKGGYKIPRIIYSDAFWSDMTAYADLVLPDTTYLERWDCISLLDRPICDADGPADAIRQPIVKPDRDVRPFQDVLIELGVRLRLAGLTNEDGSAKFTSYADYIARHERQPGIGSLAGWRGPGGAKQGRGEANPDQLQRYVANGCHWRHELAPHQRFFKFANRGYLEFAASMGFIGKADRIVLQLYSEPMQKFRLSARGHGAIQPPDGHRPRIEAYFDPLPIWYPPFEEEALDDAAFPMHAITQRPMAMYHSWGSQNAWLRQIHGANRLYINRATADSLGIADDDWVWIESPHGRVKAQARRMEGTQADTVWTWNAIGRRTGAANLDKHAPEAERGFLLNHLITELLPPREDGHRYANADPVTGQAAWYDLRVRVAKAEAAEAGETAPRFEPVPVPGSVMERPALLRYGAPRRR
jgi:sulfite dehydrogenase (quinone) subunit SoeA